jgi:hypothetical protein
MRCHKRQERAESRNANAFRTVPPSRPLRQDPSPQKPSSAANNNDGHQAVALTGGRCSSPKYPQPHSGSQSNTGDGGGGPSSHPIASDATWPMSHTP